jgi:deoxyribonuclease IV
MKSKNILLGAHISVAGGLDKAIPRGEGLGCTAIQIFTKSSRSWTAKKLLPDEIALFKSTLKKSTIKEVIAHSSYLINIGSNNKITEKKSIHALIDELERCEQLGIEYLVLHPGSHLGAGEDFCIEKIAHNLDLVFKSVKGKSGIALETVAGQGTNVGFTFEQLKKICDLCKEKKRLGICLDTCHIFSAGYNISTENGYETTIKTFDKILGLKLLKAIHLNDSKTKLGSKIDRHENIGKGTIPLKTFSFIMNDKRLINVPKILETPVKEEEEYADQIKLLCSLIR